MSMYVQTHTITCPVHVPHDMYMKSMNTYTVHAGTVVYMYMRVVTYTYMYSTAHAELTCTYTHVKNVRVISTHHVSGEALFLEYECSRARVLFEYEGSSTRRIGVDHS